MRRPSASPPRRGRVRARLLVPGVRGVQPRTHVLVQEPRSARTFASRQAAACPVTLPNRSRPPGQPRTVPWYGNGLLWAKAVRPTGSTPSRRTTAGADGSIGNKLIWATRTGSSKPAVSGERLDAPAPPLRVLGVNRGSFSGAERPSFASAVAFPTAGLLAPDRAARRPQPHVRRQRRRSLTTARYRARPMWVPRTSRIGRPALVARRLPVSLGVRAVAQRVGPVAALVFTLALCAHVASAARPASARAVAPYSGTGSWVSIYDTPAWRNPERVSRRSSRTVSTRSTSRRRTTARPSTSCSPRSSRASSTQRTRRASTSSAGTCRRSRARAAPAARTRRRALPRPVRERLRRLRARHRGDEGALVRAPQPARGLVRQGGAAGARPRVSAGRDHARPGRQQPHVLAELPVPGARPARGRRPADDLLHGPRGRRGERQPVHGGQPARSSATRSAPPSRSTRSAARRGTPRFPRSRRSCAPSGRRRSSARASGSTAR